PRCKEFGVERIGAGIATLDIVDTEFIQQLRDDMLVGQGEVDTVGLRAVAQRGVEQIEALAAHACPPLTSVFCIVVLASHSPFTVTLLRCRATYPRFLKNSKALSLASTETLLAPRAPASFSKAS